MGDLKYVVGVGVLIVLVVVFSGEFRTQAGENTPVVVSTRAPVVPAVDVLSAMSPEEHERGQAAIHAPFLPGLLMTGHIAAASEEDRAKLGKGPDEWVVTVPGLRSNQGTGARKPFKVILPGRDKSPRGDGDESQHYILEQIDIAAACAADPSLWVVDVGGLWGDFGLGTGVHGCTTIIYEPQPLRARDIARSILLNNLEGTTTVHNAAVTTMESVTLSQPPAPGSVDISGGSSSNNVGAAAKAVDIVPGERIDVVLAKEKILFLKVDVEGFEDGVIDASIGLFQEGLIQHAVFEYTPKQFEHKGTNYKDFLPRLFRDLGAKKCYLCHRLKPVVFRLPEDVHTLQKIHDGLYRISMQTDVYCMFSSAGENSNLFANAQMMSPTTSLLA